MAIGGPPARGGLLGTFRRVSLSELQLSTKTDDAPTSALNSPVPEQSARLIAIGDVHGCAAAVDSLLLQIKPTANDRLVMLGDYVDRGPNSRGVIERLIELRDQCHLVTLMGNHEEMMLRVLKGEAPANWWLRYGGVETLDSYDFTGDLAAVPPEHVAFVEACEPYYATDDFFFVHANYVAGELLADQPAEALRWQSLAEHFPEPHHSGRIAIVGHTSQKSGEVLNAGHLRCLDTYCYGGGWLTAMEVRTQQVWQAKADGTLREE